MSAKPVPLEDGHTVEIDAVDKYEWQRVSDLFSDANIYQTWSYDAIRCGERNIGHLVIRSAGEIIAAAQARIVRFPIVGVGAAYIRWGPLWKLRSRGVEPATFRAALRALRNEYVCRRGLILRIFPLIYDYESQLYSNVLMQEGYTSVCTENPGRTLIMDICEPLDIIRKKFDQKWRNCLNKAERNRLEIIEGTDDALFADFIGIYRELLQRKKFQEPNDIDAFRSIQRDLPPNSRMRVFLCRSEGVVSSGAIVAAIGDTGIYLFGATNGQGMKSGGSYLLQWKAIQCLKDSGCRHYNLNGINQLKNPGTYHFKAGLAGKNGKDVTYLGRYDSYPGEIMAGIARKVDLMMPFIRKVKSISGLQSRPKPS